MKWAGLILSLLILNGCSSGWDARQALGGEVDGARYGTGWLFGGPHIYVYPSGTVHRRYEGGTKRMRLGQKITYIDKELWQRLETIVLSRGGEIQKDNSAKDGSVCDGGYEYLHIRVGDKSGYYVFDDMDCEVTIDRHDAAGREAVQIFRELAKRLE